MSAHHGCSVPENGHKSPCQRPRNDGNMDEARRSWVAKIEKDQIQKVQDEQKLSNPEAAIDPQYYESGMEDVVEDEVTAYVPCCIGPRSVFGE